MSKILKTKPWPPQAETFKVAIKKKFFALFMEQRTGKTLLALWIIGTRYKKGKIETVLVICPKITRLVWRILTRKHLKKKYVPPVMDVINFEQAWRREKELRKANYDMIVVDESHRLKGPTTRQSKAIHRIGRNASYRLAMTGTPVVKDDTDLFGQFRFVKPELFGETLSNFRDRWCRRSGYMLTGYKLKKHLRNKFLAKVAKYSVTLTREQVLPWTPKELHEPLYFELKPRTRKIYNKLKDEFIAEFKGKKITTELEVTKMIRLHQLTGGHLQLDEDESVTSVSSEKINVVEEFLEDYPRRKALVIFCRFVPEIEQLELRLKRRGYRVGVVYGKTKDPMAVWKKFHVKRSIDIFIIQIAKAISIDLSRADTAIFFSKSFSYVDYDQSKVRLIGENENKRIGFYHIIGENTIDEYVEDAIIRKLNIANYVRSQLMKGAKQMARKEKTTKGKKSESKQPEHLKPEEFKYDVNWLAEQLDVTPFTVRMKLRAAEVKKNGRTYGWNSQKEAKAVLNKIKDIKVGKEEKEDKASSKKKKKGKDTGGKKSKGKKKKKKAA